MESLFSLFAALFGKVDNLAILVLIAVLSIMVWLYVTERKENRADRLALLDLINKNTEALNAVKLAIVAMTGRVLP